MHFKSTLILSLFLLALIPLKAQVIFEAEDAFYSSGKIDNKHGGFTGDGFVDTENKLETYIEWNIHSFKKITDSIGFKYALGKGEQRAMQVYVNSNLIDTINFDSTGEFTDYLYKYTIGEIVEGDNTIKLVSINENGAPNMDHVLVKTDTNLNLAITTAINGGGNVSSDQETLTSIVYGTRIKLNAEAAAGNTFISWSGDVSSTASDIAFTVDNNYSLTAKFVNSLKAFPGAEGFGAKVTGGRGGKVIEVTNLKNSGEGSLRAAIEATGSRTIVFKVSGTILLNSSLSIKNGNVTIAGQTASGGGITIARHSLKIDADNVIVRFIRSRLGDTDGSQDDAISCRKHKNVIVDHCTFSWSVDEVASFYDNQNVTVQYCLISEALYNSIHEKGNHSYGGIWGGQGVSFHHNLFSSNTSRNPRFCGSRYTNQPDLELVDFRNNVLFNWGFNSIYGAEGGNYNLVNNYYKPGPATSSNVRNRIIAPDPSGDSNNQPAGIWGMFYVDGNYMTNSEAVTENNWAGVSVDIDKSTILTQTAFEVDSVTTQTAQMAYEQVLHNVGAILPARDVIDTRIINEVISGQLMYGASYGEGTGILDSQSEVGGWPELESIQAPADTDKDGMPDAWENAMGLDATDPEDRNDDLDGNGYTNLEKYLNELAESYSYLNRPTNFVLDNEENGKIALSWDDTESETAYLLEKAVNEGRTFEQLAILDADVTSYEDIVTEMGTYYYRLQALSGSDSSLFCDYLKVNVNDIVDVSENYAQAITVYPNPFKNTIQIKFSGKYIENTKLRIVNLLGKIVYESTLNRANSAINTRELKAGIYFIQVLTSTETNSCKIIKN